MSRGKKTEAEKMQYRITKRLNKIKEELKAIGHIVDDIEYIDLWSHKLFKHADNLEKGKS
jgi:hypothetical protein